MNEEQLLQQIKNNIIANLMSQNASLTQEQAAEQADAYIAQNKQALLATNDDLAEATKLRDITKGVDPHDATQKINNAQRAQEAQQPQPTQQLTREERKVARKAKWEETVNNLKPQQDGWTIDDWKNWNEERKKTLSETEEQKSAREAVAAKFKDSAKTQMQPVMNALGDAAAGQIYNSVASAARSPSSKHYDRQAALQDELAARREKAAQRNQQIASRDYKQVSAEEAVSAGNAAAMNAASQTSAAAGAGAAALNALNASNQAVNNTYSSQLATNKARADERADKAYDQAGEGQDARIQGEEQRKEATSLDTSAQAAQREKKEREALSLSDVRAKNIISILSNSMRR